MEPTLHGGDLLLVRQQGGYSAGDIVAYRVPEGDPAEGRIVVHRVAGGSPAEGFIMQGDNKQAPDYWRPSQDDIVGKMWISVPHVAGLVGILRTPIVMGSVAAAVAAFMVLSHGEEKKRPRGVSPAKGSGGAGRLRPPPGLTLWLLLILTATLVGSLAFTARY